jgi:hypothetical protein
VSGTSINFSEPWQRLSRICAWEIKRWKGRKGQRVHRRTLLMMLVEESKRDYTRRTAMGVLQQKTETEFISE